VLITPGDEVRLDHEKARKAGGPEPGPWVDYTRARPRVRARVNHGQQITGPDFGDLVADQEVEGAVKFVA
jgi:hypothetical protein